MEDKTQEPNPNPTTQNLALINSFCEITSSDKEEAHFFLESHQWDLDAAVSTFFDSSASLPVPPPPSLNRSASPSQSPSNSPEYSPSQSPSRSRSPSPAPARVPYELRSRRAADKKPSGSSARGIRTLADLNRTPPDGSDSDSDDGQDYYTGGEKSGMLVRDPSKRNDVDAIFNHARQVGAVEGSSDSLRPSSSTRSFTGTARLLSGETVSHSPQPPEVVTHNVTFWRNGFTVDDGPLRRLDDPANASFLESVMKSQCPKELEPADRRTKVDLHLIKRDENYSEPQKQRTAFQGVGRTLGNTSTTTESTPAEPTATASKPSTDLVVDESLPTTSIQLRLADGTRMVSRFNYHHTIGDIRGFIDASRNGGAGNYQLMTMGFPPKQLTDPNQTIEQAGIASSVVIQKF